MWGGDWFDVTTASPVWSWRAHPTTSQDIPTGQQYWLQGPRRHICSSNLHENLQKVRVPLDRILTHETKQYGVRSIRVFSALSEFYHIMLFLVIRLITSDPHIEEIDFEHNYIGDAAGREILHAMQQRRDGNTHHSTVSCILYACMITTLCHYPGSGTKMLHCNCLTCKNLQAQ